MQRLDEDTKRTENRRGVPSIRLLLPTLLDRAARLVVSTTAVHAALYGRNWPHVGFDASHDQCKLSNKAAGGHKAPGPRHDPALR